jgi:hypothetical protein
MRHIDRQGLPNAGTDRLQEINKSVSVLTQITYRLGARQGTDVQQHPGTAFI